MTYDQIRVEVLKLVAALDTLCANENRASGENDPLTHAIKLAASLGATEDQINAQLDYSW